MQVANINILQYNEEENIFPSISPIIYYSYVVRMHV